MSSILLGALMFSGYMLVGREIRSRYAINTIGVYGVSAILLAIISILIGARFASYSVPVFASQQKNK